MIRYFVQHATAANLLMVLIVLLGIIGTISMNRQVFPEFDPGFIQVQVIYKGASAEDVEETICELIEESLEGIEGIAQVKSTCREGIGQVRVEVIDSYRTADVLTDVRNVVEQINNFPENAEKPAIWEIKKQSEVMTITLTGDISKKDMQKLAEQIKKELQSLEKVSLVSNKNISDHQIHIAVKQKVLLDHNLTIQDISKQIKMQSLDLPAGSIETDEQELKIRILDQRRAVESFRNLPIITNASGVQIPLRALADVTSGFEQKWRKAYYKGVECINIKIDKTEKEDTITIAEAVEKYLKERRKSLPPGVSLIGWGYWSKPVKERLGMMLKNGVLGFILVFFTLWFFLDLHLAFWVALGIPVSFLATMYVFDAIGMTLNMISTFSLIIALGIIVDDAIVLGENIYTHHSMGKNGMQAAIQGCHEVAVAVIASMLTTIAIFFPLINMKGEMGKTLLVIPYGVIAALTVSLLEAFLILPHHLGTSLSKHAKKSKNTFRKTIDNGMDWFIEKIYGRAISWCISHRAITISAILMVFLISIGQIAGGRIKFTPFPKLDGDIVTVRIMMIQGTPVEQTRKVVKRLEDALKEVNSYFKPKQPDKQDLILHYTSVFGTNMDRQEEEVGPHVAIMFMEMLSADIRKTTCDQVLNLWQQKVGEIPDVISINFGQLQVTPGGKAISIQLKGKDLATLSHVSRALQAKLQSFPGIRNLTDDLRPGKEEIRLHLRDTAHSLNITSVYLANQLRSVFLGEKAQEFQKNSENISVEVRLALKNRRSLSDLENFKVRTPQGHQVPLLEVAKVRLERGFGKIVRVDRDRTVTISADIDPAQGNANQIISSLSAGYFNEIRQKYPGVAVKLGGQYQETAKTLNSVWTAFIVGLAIVYMVLALVFKSYLEPFIIMSVIPFAVVGGIWGHMLMGIDWTMPSIVGFVSLAGIVVNDSIVLVEFIKLRIKQGVSINETIVEAGKARFRAVFLTSATTVAGLLPMLLEKSMQAQFLIPMANSICFGLIFATVLVLFLVPCLYSIIVEIM